jgi:hypothetical protein
MIDIHGCSSFAGLVEVKVAELSDALSDDLALLRLAGVLEVTLAKSL